MMFFILKSLFNTTISALLPTARIPLSESPIRRAGVSDIIFETRAYDLGYCYQPAWLNKNLIYMLNEGNFDWASRYASLEPSAQATLDLISMSYRSAIGK